MMPDVMGASLDLCFAIRDTTLLSYGRICPYIMIANDLCHIAPHRIAVRSLQAIPCDALWFPPARGSEIQVQLLPRLINLVFVELINNLRP